MRRLLLITSVALAALGLAACGGSKTESADTTAAAAPATSAEPGGGGSAEPSAGGSEFCTQVGEIFQRHADALTSIAATPQLDPSNPQAAMAQMAEYGQKLVAPMQEIQQVAPPEVKSDVDALVSGFEALASGDPQALATASTQMQGAGQNFATYMSTNCPGTGLANLGSGGAGTGTATGPG